VSTVPRVGNAYPTPVIWQPLVPRPLP
jgi:hypothetical protein